MRSSVIKKPVAVSPLAKSILVLALGELEVAGEEVLRLLGHRGVPRVQRLRCQLEGFPGWIGESASDVDGRVRRATDGDGDGMFCAGMSHSSDRVGRNGRNGRNGRWRDKKSNQKEENRPGTMESQAQ